MQRQRGFGLIEVLIIVVVLAAIGGIAWYVMQPKTQVTQAPPVPTPVQTEQPKPAPPAMKKYVNMKYGYSFEYPVDAVVYEDGPFGGERLPLTINADSLAVEVGEKRVTVSGTGYTAPTAERIHQEFSSTVSPQDINIAQTTLGGGRGLKATFKDPQYTGSFYFIQKGDHEPVIKISVSAGLESIISSFKYE